MRVRYPVWTKVKASVKFSGGSSKTLYQFTAEIDLKCITRQSSGSTKQGKQPLLFIHYHTMQGYRKSC